MSNLFAQSEALAFSKTAAQVAADGTPALAHDSSSNALIRRYRHLRDGADAATST